MADNSFTLDPACGIGARFLQYFSSLTLQGAGVVHPGVSGLPRPPLRNDDRVSSRPNTGILISEAGEPGDRRLAFRKECRREESPDSSCGELARVGCSRATRLVTPGGCVTRGAQARHGDVATESATENKPPVSFDLGGRLAEKPQARQFWSSAFGKGEKVG